MGAATAILGFALGGVLAAQDFSYFLASFFAQPASPYSRFDTLPSLVGLSPATFILLAVLLLGIIIVVYPRSGRNSGSWPWYFTGAAIGVIGTLAWVAGKSSGWQWGLSVVGPTRSVAYVLAGQSSNAMTWGFFMILGVPTGSFLSAWLNGETRWQMPAVAELPQRFTGGLLMGVGGTLAAGCNIGNALTGLSVLSTNSLLATVSLIGGLFLGVRVQRYHDQQRPDDGTKSTAFSRRSICARHLE